MACSALDEESEDQSDSAQKGCSSGVCWRISVKTNQQRNGNLRTQSLTLTVDVNDIVHHSADQISSTQVVEGRVVQFRDIASHDSGGEEADILETIQLSAFSSDNLSFGGFRYRLMSVFALSKLRILALVETHQCQESGHPSEKCSKP